MTSAVLHNARDGARACRRPAALLLLALVSPVVLLAGAPSAAASAENQSGHLALDYPGASAQSFLDTSLTDVDVRASTALNRDQTGGGTYVSLVGRHNDDTGDYRLKLRHLQGGAVTAALVQTAPGVENTLTSALLPDVSYSAGEVLQLRLQVTGVGPVQIRAKAWQQGTAEPGAWLLEATQSSQTLEGPGVAGVFAYVSSSSVTAPEVVNFDGLQAEPVQTATPPALPAPAGGRPTPETTGVPAGTSLRPYYGDLTITTPGATYDALDIHGFVTVKAPNVTITRSIIRGGRANGVLGLITNTTPSATNFTVSDSELVPEYPSVWLDGIKGFNYTARRIDAHGTVDLAKVYGDNVTIEGSWLHDAQDYSSDPFQNGGPTHNDGVQVLGGSNIHITGNLIYGASNAALQVTQNAGSVNAEFSGNWVDGGNCTVNVRNQPLPTLTGMTVRNNRFGHNTRYLDCAVISQPQVTLQVSGNVWDDTGLPVRLRLKG